MINNTIGKTIQAWLDKHADIIDSYHMEEDEFGGYRSPWSIWVYFKPGHIGSSTETHMIHETNVRDFLYAAAMVIPCSCDQCINSDGEHL